MINKYILDFIYLMPWKFVCDLRFHEVLQTTIIWQLIKGNVEIKKSKNTVKNLGIVYKSLCVLVSVCVYAGYSCVLLCVDM